MTREFVYTSHPMRVVFGSGTTSHLAQEVRALGGSRVLLLTGARGTPAGERVKEALGPLMAARFDGAAAHTPVGVTEEAMGVLGEHAVDCLVAVGGGSTIGLSKALAARTGMPQVVLPTTYAGSEVTPVLGETTEQGKTTRSGPEILPEAVVYDVDFTLGLPVATSVTSGINAMAHSVEALYSEQANPIVDGWALESVARMGRALPRIVADPSDPEARTDALHAAWLAGTCLGLVGMGLHHKLCHTLGGSFSLPHAPTHTVVLAHATAYNAPAAPEGMARVAEALGAHSAPAGVHDLVESLGGPLSLRELGMAERDVAAAAEAATARTYPNPRPVTFEGVTELLSAAWHGKRPA